jgi:hypothetical protein
MRRSVISWVAAFALLIAGFAASVVALNADTYSAHGFVAEYLDALARKDSAAALASPGVVLPNGLNRELLADGALGSLSDIDFVSEKVGKNNVHHVLFSYSLANGKHSSEFSVEPNGSRLGLFTRWRFVISPLATVSVAVLNSDSFSVNGLETKTNGKDGTAKPFLILSPGFYIFDHESTFLTSRNVPITVTDTSTNYQAIVEPTANAKFTKAAAHALAIFLDTCAAQKVLMPTACPFGEFLDNRINDLPAWSIVDYPEVSIVAGTRPGEWLVKQAKAVAHIVVEQKSVFDGSLKTIDDDVPFTSDYVIVIGANDELTVTADFE